MVTAIQWNGQDDRGAPGSFAMSPLPALICGSRQNGGGLAFSVIQSLVFGLMALLPGVILAAESPSMLDLLQTPIMRIFHA